MSSEEEDDGTDVLSPDDFPERFEDITRALLDCCAQVRLGELVTCSNFTLFEAMSSIELMDPKMDSGMVCNQISRPVVSLADAVDQKLVAVCNISHDICVVMCDTLLRSVVAFLEGHSLAQTVFTCLYLHNPDVVAQPELKYLLIGVLRIVDRLIAIMVEAAVFEEEDIHLMTFNFRFYEHISDRALMNNLKEQIDLISHKHEQLACRLFMIHSLIGILATIRAKNEQEIKKLPQILDRLKEKISKLQRAPCNAQFDAELLSEGVCYSIGFDTLLNQHLLPPTFPKNAEFTEWDCMTKYWVEIISTVRKVCVVYPNASFQSVMLLVSGISRDSGSSLASRSMVQVMVMPSLTHVCCLPIKQFLSSGICSLVSHVPITSDNLTISRIANELCLLVERPVITWIKGYGKNRARLREQYIHVYYELSQAQNLCAEADACLEDVLGAQVPQFHRLSTWLMIQVSTVIREYLLSGLELELYSEHELLALFWYLADFLLLWNCNMLNDVREKLTELRLPPECGPDQQAREKNAKKQKQKQKMQSMALLEAQSANYKFHQALLSLFCGYYKSLIFLNAYHRIKKVTEPDFDLEKVRFERRFLPIAHIADCFPSFERFQAAVFSHVNYVVRDPERVIREAAESFSDAKSLLTEAKVISASSVPVEAELYLKLASNNLVVLNLARNTTEPQSKLSLEFSKLYFNWPALKYNP